jgi:NAD(P)-dependent dehydrogenase (short-subunit alcohol dehydrogenase family)
VGDQRSFGGAHGPHARAADEGARRRPRVVRRDGRKCAAACTDARLLRLDLAGTGITVNTISPGILGTAEVKESLLRRAEREGWGAGPDVLDRAAREWMPNPSGVLGRVEDVGALVAFLCSQHASYINGADYRIDGGAADCV